MFEQTVYILIRLLFKEQSDQDLHRLPFCLHLLEALLHCKIKLFYIKDNYDSQYKSPNFQSFMVSVPDMGLYSCGFGF